LFVPTRLAVQECVCVFVRCSKKTFTFTFPLYEFCIKHTYQLCPKYTKFHDKEQPHTAFPLQEKCAADLLSSSLSLQLRSPLGLSYHSDIAISYGGNYKPML
jgi:hypothetical protein